jgi:hypothetical protein
VIPIEHADLVDIEDHVTTHRRRRRCGLDWGSHASLTLSALFGHVLGQD